MTGAQIITQTMEQFPERELILASKLYTEQLSEAVSEEAYYQTLGRMCKAGSLCRIAKGTYYRPNTSKYCTSFRSTTFILKASHLPAISSVGIFQSDK